MKIPFNIPYLSGNEVNYINDVIKIQRYSSAGKYNQLFIFCDLTDEQLNIIIKAAQDYYLG